MENERDWLADNPKTALLHIYKFNYAWLEKYILKNSGSVDDARDVFQESVLAAWVNLKSGRFSGSQDQFNAYLRQICKYKWITVLRSAANKRTLYTEDPAVFEGHPDSEQNFDEQILESTQLKSSLEALGEKCRAVLNLFYYEQKSLAEIAIAQQNTEESIKTIKYRCMMQLRKIYLEKNKEDRHG